MSTRSEVAKVVPIKSGLSQSPAEAREDSPVPPAGLPEPVSQVQQKGKQQLQKALRSLFDSLDDTLFEQADKSNNNTEQNIYFDAMREYRVQRRAMEETFFRGIDRAFALLSKEAEHGALDSASADSLSLVDDEDLDELVAVDSMINRANEACGEGLQHLSLRMDSLLPVKVYQKNNPVGPDVICRQFVEATRPLEVDIKAKLVLFKLFDQHLVNGLPAMYDDLNAVLVEHNVLPSLQHSKPRTQSRTDARTEATARPRAESGVQPQAGPGANATAVAANGILLGALSQLQSQQQAQWAEAPSQDVSAVQLDISGLLTGMLSSQNQSQAVEQQREVINLVKMLFEFILDDRSLADAMKALIGRLQIPILKLAIIDETFFKQSGHPARKLLNEMSTASLGWQEDPKLEKGQQPKDPLYKKVHEIVYRLLEEFEDDVHLFSELLTDFVSFLEKERRRASLLEQRTIDAEDGKAKAEAARRQVADAMEKIVDGQQVPAAVTHILDDAWSNVLFLICLRGGTDGANWEKGLATAEDLVWSVTTPVDADSRKTLMTLIPNLVKRLRQGLEKISYNPFEMTKLLEQLEKIHMARLTGAELPAGDEADSPAEMPEASGPGQKETPEDSYLERVDRLTQGTWFVMTDDGGRQFRCRLAAIIKSVGKYIFVNRSGMKVAEKNRESLALAMKSGSLEMLDDSMLFDRALESVIGGARKRH